MKLAPVYLILAIACLQLAISTVDAQTQVTINNREINDKMDWMENEIRKVVESGCSIQVDSLATYIKTIWWPHIQYLASRTSPKEQQRILIKYNRFLFMLGSKKCESPNETWYQGRCQRIGIPGNPCPKYQQLYDGPDNTGYCYCQRNGGNSNGLIYLDGQCYKQNEQGPCGNGQWLTVKNQSPRCERVPRGCPADGQHVYWGCNDGQTNCPSRRIQSNNQMKCSRIGSTQPTCGAGAKLIRNGMKTYCGSPKMMDRREPSVNMVLPSTCSSNQVQQSFQLIQPYQQQSVEQYEVDEPMESMQEEYFSDYNQMQEDPFEERIRVNNNRPCPRNYYRDTADGRCKRLY